MIELITKKPHVTIATPDVRLEELEDRVEALEEKEIEIDLTDYVKNTDYGSQTVSGLCRGNVALGTYLGVNGTIVIQSATLSEIDARKNANKPIVPTTLDYAVKSVTYDKAEIDIKFGDIEAAFDELHNYAQALVNGGAAV